MFSYWRWIYYREINTTDLNITNIENKIFEIKKLSISKIISINTIEKNIFFLFEIKMADTLL